MVSVSKTWTKDFNIFRSGRSLKLLGYDTLEEKNWKSFHAAGDVATELRRVLQPQADPGSLREEAETLLEKSQSLIERVGAVLQSHGVNDGSYLTFQQCEALVEAGVVVELLLLPMARLRDVIRWRLEDNII